MAHSILMPKAGQSMTEGKIVAWLAQEGDPIEKGQPLLEIETDKANLEVEALSSGVLRKIVAGEGEVCPVLSVVGVIGTPDEPIDVEALQAAAKEARKDAEPDKDAKHGADARHGAEAPAAAAQSKPPEAAGAPAPEAARSAGAAGAPPAGSAGDTAGGNGGGGNGRGVLASPLARRIAEERGVMLEALRGTGPGGRILRRDVENAPARAGHAGTPGALKAPGAIDFGALAAAKPYPPPAPRPPARVPVEGVRKAIASALQQSKQSIPHFYVAVTADVTQALALREDLVAGGRKISVNDLVLRAVQLALRDEPGVNCRVFAEYIEYPEDVNIGIAVDSDRGLVVPVVLEAQSHGLLELAAASRQVIGAAREGKLMGAGQGTFTISNLGMFGVDSFSAIINPPEGAILAVGAVRLEVRPVQGGFLPRATLQLTLSADHRAIDGVLAARFLARMRVLLEEPERLR